jgi:hypothetical protein
MTCPILLSCVNRRCGARINKLHSSETNLIKPESTSPACIVRLNQIMWHFFTERYKWRHTHGEITIATPYHHHHQHPYYRLHHHNYITEQGDNKVTLLTYSREEPGSNFSRDTNFPDWRIRFSGLWHRVALSSPLSFQRNVLPPSSGLKS